VKISEHINSQDLSGLVAFAEEYGTKNLYVVSQEPRMRKITLKGKDIIIMNYKKFLEKLWVGEIMGE
jgi:sulfur relay (sulfurtransferase) DsrF/TusC family protein